MCATFFRGLCVLSILFLTSLSFGQSIPELPHLRDDSPSYMQYFNRPVDQVDVNEVIKAYKEYYRTHKFEKNEYTQYY